MFPIYQTDIFHKQKSTSSWISDLSQTLASGASIARSVNHQIMRHSRQRISPARGGAIIIAIQLKIDGIHGIYFFKSQIKCIKFSVSLCVFTKLSIFKRNVTFLHSCIGSCKIKILDCIFRSIG